MTTGFTLKPQAPVIATTGDTFDKRSPGFARDLVFVIMTPRDAAIPSRVGTQQMCVYATTTSVRVKQT